MRKSPEHVEQTGYFYWARQHEGQYPELQFVHAVPNGRQRTWIDAKWLHDEGVRGGPPDVMYDGDSSGQTWPGFRLEFKQPGCSHETSELQDKFLSHYFHVGLFVAVVDYWQEAVNITIQYLGLPIRQQPVPPHLHRYPGGRMLGIASEKLTDLSAWNLIAHRRYATPGAPIS